MSLPKPYYQDSHVTIYNADCREILPLLDPVDLVTKDLTVSTKTSILNYDEKQKRTLQKDGIRSALGTTQGGVNTPLLYGERVNSKNCEKVRRLSNRDGQNIEKAFNCLEREGAERGRKRTLQERGPEYNLPENDFKKMLFDLPRQECPPYSSCEQHPHRQQNREPSSSLYLLPHATPQKRVLGSQKIICITDPPYGIKRDKGFEGFEGFGGFGAPIARKRFEDDNWDQFRPDKAVFDLILKICDLSIIFGGNFFADILPQSTHWIFWDKLQTMPTFGDGELAWTNSKRKSIKKITVEYNGLIGREKWRAHPTQKPLKLFTNIIKEYSDQFCTILDPFMGSGTTLRAAKDLNRKAIGIELEEKYCAIAVERLRQEVLAL